MNGAYVIGESWYYQKDNNPFDVCVFMHNSDSITVIVCMYKWDGILKFDDKHLPLER